MASKVLIALAMITSAALSACTRSTVSSQAELYEWMRDHGLVDTLVIGDVHIECAMGTQHLPPAGAAADLSKIPFQVMLTMKQHQPKAGGDVIFNGIESVDDFSSRVRNLALRFSEQVVLTQGAERVKCLGATMDYDIGLTRRKKVMLTFPLTMKRAAGSDVTIHIADMIIEPKAADFMLRTSNIPSLPTVQP